ncbi:5-hydroxytryptamine receptor 2A-like [Centruroides sculpturatus]|uniref:5-hydroxytryptamine receptor 2A-like n=1 Tax=Centruroides sculpturatus TaxID=218467 RepID=UPI000C6D912A|nr:5-hydroxytryptamine receptor 2A-like [Centruroides sculpturatus]
MQSNMTFDFYNFTVEDPIKIDIIGMVVMSVLLGIIILATVVGNLFVIAAIFIEKNLQSVGNYLVLSLGVADLMVACLVMPLGAVNEVNQEWIMGPELCDVWTACDVLCCTASILHLLAIAVDRFWAVTNVDYARQRNAKHIYIMILLVWIVSFVVSLAPIFGWKDPDFAKRLEEEKRCLVSQDVAYQIFATFSSFYVPLVVILILYWRIWKEARKRIRHRPGAKAVLVVQKSSGNITPPSTADLPSTSSTSNGVAAAQTGVGRLLLIAKRDKKSTRIKESMESKRERKAAKTLAIITGVFVVCWLPFFVVALVMPICSCELSQYIFSFFLWLGYANSMLNPLIYTIFSPDFRNAFKRILCGPQSTQRS